MKSDSMQGRTGSDFPAEEEFLKIFSVVFSALSHVLISPVVLLLHETNFACFPAGNSTVDKELGINWDIFPFSVTESV